jgi:hypothetical protein
MTPPYWERKGLTETEHLEEAAKYWDELAVRELDRLNWDVLCADKVSCEFRANSFRRTAEALRIQILTGIAVCSCCHKPIGEGMRF